MIEAAIKVNLEMFKRYPKLSRIGFQLLKMRGRPIYRKVFRRFEKISSEFLERFIKQGLEQGEIRDDVPLEFLIKFLNMVFFHLNDLYEDEDSFDRVKEYLSYLMSILKHGLMKQ